MIVLNFKIKIVVLNFKIKIVETYKEATVNKQEVQ